MEKRKKQQLKKLLIVGIIVVLVGVIWLLRNTPQTPKDKDLVVSEAIEGYFQLDVTERIDLEELTSYGLPIIIDFGADSCAPCIEMAPILEALNEELSGQAIVLFVDVFKYQQIMEGFPIQVIPSQVIIDVNGVPFVPSDELAAQTQFNMYSQKDTKEHIFTVHQGGLTEEQMREILKEMGVE